MPNSSRYRWQARWSVDRTAGTARHEFGIVFTCAGPRARAVDADQALGTLAARNGRHNATRMLARLVREAAAVFSAADPREARL